MSSIIPRYQKACLAADTSTKSVYLVGASSSQTGLLEIYHISLADSIINPSSSRVGFQEDNTSWSSSKEKACYAYQLPSMVNVAVEVIQFGQGASYQNTFPLNGTVGQPTLFDNQEFQSSKLFSWVGSYSGAHANIFHMYGVSPSTLTGSRW
ncbi:hypothetical protein BGZ95_006659, partial [Linnemannia exigua]